MIKVLTEFTDHPESHTLAFYESRGGYQAARKAITQMSRADVVGEVKASGLRGRGGAGFPTGVKWSFIPQDNPKPKYLIVNADESEPGTFKDRLLLEKNPHAVIEGIIIGAYAISAHYSYVYIRGEFATQQRIFEQAVQEAYAKGYLGNDLFGKGYDLELVVHRGAGAYICGEETALINSLEGKRGYPRLKPPFPVTNGAWNAPTCVNNVETIAVVPWIIRHGGAEYSKIGAFEPGEPGKPAKVDSRGTRLMCLSGHISNPGVYEIELGISIGKFIADQGGGVWKGRKLKAVIPGGSSTPILSAEEALDAKLTYEDCARLKTMFGSGGMMIIDDQQCMVQLLAVLLRFYAHESCGQCSPCREGTDWLYRLVRRMEEGDGQPEDIQTLRELCVGMEGRTVCPLAAAATMPTISFLERFLPEFEAHVAQKCCPYDAAPKPALEGARGLGMGKSTPSHMEVS